MIHFQHVKYRNFLSTGNQPTKVELNRHSTTLISGQNGAGKSTILDALCFGIFGKPYRNINKPQLLNTVNEKGLEVEVAFEVNNVPYRVVRGIKPVKFEIYQNETLIKHDAAIKDYQRKLEQIIGLNYKAFTQIVILGSARYQSFMDLGTNDRRTIIEEILDITVFSKMNSVLKTRAQTVELDIKENDYQKDIIKTKIVGQKGLIKSILNRSKESDEAINQKRGALTLEKKTLEERLSVAQAECDEAVRIDIENYKNKLVEATHKGKDLVKKIKEVEKKQKFYETTDVCHTCEQTVSDDIKATQLGKLSTEKEQLEKILPTMDEVFANLKETIKSGEESNSIYEEKQKVRDEIQNEIKAIDKVLASLVVENKEGAEKELTEAYEVLESMENEFRKIESETIRLSEQRHQLEICKVLLKDDGIKAKIIKQYLPIMNNLINQNLDRMGANYSFHLDEQFNEVIKSRYRDNFSYASFSEGEKMRIDLALMFTWREVAKLKNSVNTNLLVMDEVGDSSLDGEATDILWEMVGDLQDANVFVISHKTSNGDKFQSLIEFVKEGNFSKMKIPMK